MAKKTEVDDVAAQVEDNYEEDFIEDDTEECGIIKCTTYGSDVFDLAAGGGAPWGKMVNIVGDNSTCKTLVASEIIAQAYWSIVRSAPKSESDKWGEKTDKSYEKKRDTYVKNILEWFYDDAESGYSFDSKAIWGINIVTDEMTPSFTIEDFHINVKNKLKALPENKYFIYIVDSYDSLTSIEEDAYVELKMDAIENDKKIKGTYGQSKAKGGHQFFRTLRHEIKKKNCLLIIISQVKENLEGGLFGTKYIRTGGKALDFYSAQVWWLGLVEKYEKKGVKTGISIKAKNTKNKTGKPYREALFDVIFDYGMDNISSNLKYLYDLKTDTGKDKDKINTVELEWDGAQYKLPKLIEHIENSGLERQLTRKVQRKWHEFEESISTKRKSRFE